MSETAQARAKNAELTGQHRSHFRVVSERAFPRSETCPTASDHKKYNERGVDIMAGEGIKIFFLIDTVLTEMMTVRQAAYHLKYHERTIQRWAEEGKLIAINVDGRWWLDAVQIYSVGKALDCSMPSVAS
jgi:excisionase family DNA binding protein